MLAFHFRSGQTEISINKRAPPRVWGGGRPCASIGIVVFFPRQSHTKNNNGITQQYEQRLPQYSSDRHPACLLQPEIPHALFLPPPTSPLSLVFSLCFLCLEKLCFSHLPFPSYGRWGPRPDPMPGGSKKSMHAAYVLLLCRAPPPRAYFTPPF